MYQFHGRNRTHVNTRINKQQPFKKTGPLQVIEKSSPNSREHIVTGTINYHRATTHCQLPSHSKVSKLGMTFEIEENVTSLNVSVNLPLKVKILQTL